MFKLYPDSDTVSTRGIIWFPVIPHDRNPYCLKEGTGKNQQPLSVMRGTRGGSELINQSQDSVVGVSVCLERGQAAVPSSIVPENTPLSAQDSNSPAAKGASDFHGRSCLPTS